MYQNKSAFLISKEKFEFRDAEIPEPKDDEVQLRPATIGICGSDVHYWTHLQCGTFKINFERDGPLILGHETSAIVTKVGKNVTHLKEGDRVCIEPGIPCRYCVMCKSGKYNLCSQMRFHATPPINGTFQTYITHPADFCFKLNKISLDEGALIEPLSVGVHACGRGEVKAGSCVLISGPGPIGIVCLKVAKAQGATKVIMLGNSESRLQFAKKAGADVVINIKKFSEEEVIQKIKEHAPITHGFECSGSDQAIQLLIKGVSQGAKIMTIGRGASENQMVPLHLASDKEIDIIGSFRYRNSYKYALDLVESGKVNVRDMITHAVEFDDIQEAFELTKNAAKSGAVKVIIRLYVPEGQYKPKF